MAAFHFHIMMHSCCCGKKCWRYDLAFWIGESGGGGSSSNISAEPMISEISTWFYIQRNIKMKISIMPCHHIYFGHIFGPGPVCQYRLGRQWDFYSKIFIFLPTFLILYLTLKRTAQRVNTFSIYLIYWTKINSAFLTMKDT